MKNTGIGLLVISFFGLVNTVQSSMPLLSIPKVSSHKSLDRHGKKDRKKVASSAQAPQAEQVLSKADREIVDEIAIAACFRYSGCGRPLTPEYQKAIQDMKSLSQARKWRLIGLMQNFDQVLQEYSEENDKELAKIRTKMYSLDSDDSKVAHAHVPKGKHKRGDSF